MSRKNKKLYPALLLIAFAIIILIGRFVIYPPVDTSVPAAQSVSSGKTFAEKQAERSQQHQQQSVSAPQTPQQRCESELQTSIEANKTEYDRGSILVSFKNDVSFSQAVSLLAEYELTVVSESETRQSYPDNRIVTAHVPSGKEVFFICSLRQNSQVKHAGLNVLFSLHQ